MIQNFINKHYVYTLKIQEKFKSILDKVQYYFKVMENENLKKLDTLKILYENGNLDPVKIANILNKDVQFGHYEVFVIDKNYKIIDASYKPEIGFNLGQFKIYRKILQSVFDEKIQIHISPPHIDTSSMNVKKYFLVRSPNGKYLLQLAYVVDMYSLMKKIYQDVLKDVPDLKKLDVFFVEKYLMYRINFEKRFSKKLSLDTVLSNTYKLLKNILKEMGFNKNDIKKILDNISKNYFISKVITEIFNERKDKLIIFNEDTNSLIIYSMIESVFDNQIDRLLLRSEFSTKELMQNINTLKSRFYINFFIVAIAIFIVYKFIIFRISYDISKIIDHMKKNKRLNIKTYIQEVNVLKEIYNEFRDKLNSEIEKNKNLLKENKRFIVDTIHQIKTPLSVITLNLDYITSKTTNEEMLEILEEIEAAVTMLTNSYEDLSYLSGNGILKYEANGDLDLSKVTKERIHFFNAVSKANNKTLHYDIEKEVKFKINKIEFERIVDNNISNAIKYSTKNDIFVSLKKVNNKIILRFESYGEKIKNSSAVFDKNYREHSHKRGLGIGLNIVKGICEKYNIEYTVYYKDGKNIFEYVFTLMDN
ncbi:hypothetical protein JCM11957_14920 [Caminibacter profundus]